MRPEAVTGSTEGFVRFIDEDGDLNSVVTWEQLDDRGAATMCRLQEAGVKSGDVVGVAAPTGPAHVTTLIALWQLGASVCVLPDAATTDVIQLARGMEAAARSGAAAVVCRDTARDRIASLGLLPLDLDWLVLDGPGARTSESGLSTHRGQSCEATGTAVVQLTSGSMDPRRAVDVRWSAIHHNNSAMAARLGLRTDDIILSWMPLHHDMGLVGGLLLARHIGCSLVLAPTEAFSRNPGLWPGWIREFRPTVLLSPGFGYRILGRSMGPGRSSALASVRHAVNGSEPIRHSDVEQFLHDTSEHAFDPMAMAFGYGLAEATLAVSLAHPLSPPRFDWIDASPFRQRAEVLPVKRGRPDALALAVVGEPLAGMVVKVGGATAESTEGDRQPGLITVGGPSACPYLEGPRVDDHVDTGDIGYWADGELVICGRRKAMVKVSGVSLYAEDIEGCCESLPQVVSGGSVALDLGQLGEGSGLALIVEERSPSTDLDRTVRALVSDTFGIAPRVVRIVSRGAIPRTTSGKRMRWACAELIDAPCKQDGASGV